MSDNYRSRQERRKAQESAKRNHKKPDKEKQPKRSIWRKVFISLLIAGIILLTAGTITTVAIISKAPALDPDELVFSQAAEIYDQNGEEITRLQAGENRDLIDINELPEHAKSAFVAIEDVRYYDHFGIDIRRLFGALAANITGGFGAEGASTITQQVVKNAFLSTDKTITRKVQEQYLAIRLEQQYSKNQILEMYLNLIYFNQGAYGIGEASKIYFNKSDITELTIEDAALLAAIPRRPSYYDPTQNPDAAQDRRDRVIDLMAEHNFISDEDAQQAKSVSVEEQLDFSPTEEGVVYDSFITQVQNELEEVDGITSSDIYSSGLKVHTTLDTNAQDFAEEVIQTNQHINNYPENDDFQVGFTLLDTQTGAIKAMVGNRQGQDVARGLNYAARSNAQPGSTIKPLLDYGPAIEHNEWSTYHQLEDAPHQYSNGQEITNYSGNYAGNVSMREALVRSLNIPAVKALQQTGLEEAGDFVRGLGIPMEEVNEAAALGGVNEGVSSLDMAGAYAAFGNNGQYTEPYAVRKIEFPDGREINLEPESTSAMSDYTAYMITDMLKDVLTDSRGTGRAANIPGLPVAGKTGTTNFTDKEHQQFNIPSGGDPDVWFSGYTTQYTASVWTGFSGRRGENYLINDESDIAKEIFRLIMSNVSEDIDTPDFAKPDSVEEIQIEKSTGKRASPFTPSSEAITELFVKGTGPEEVSKEFTTPSEINGLNAVYNEETDEIQLSWNYDEEELEGRAFEIEHRVDNEDYQSINTQNEMTYSLSNPEKGTTHQFRVTVINQEGPDDSSDSAEVQVSIPDSDELDEESDENQDQNEEDERENDEEAPSDNDIPNEDGRNNENENGNENGNRNDNGNGNENGNGNGNDENDEDPLEDLPLDDDDENENNNEENAEEDNNSEPDTDDDEADND
ncbi:penicillin-binding protein 1A [Alteribacillus bidgolensis]|uniref:Penicillin-binding protein 1A n=1 Tax=Alteribacillus bidgolensis TaxID=930129 RepID=A0A1G8CAC8_9BACI|nr:penicillin-binding protein 1A [Alteribacillus bidgolensis]SDH42269.1 penicillin-binding protein 1A [Alteribacillus bidgolensis]